MMSGGSWGLKTKMSYERELPKEGLVRVESQIESLIKIQNFKKPKIKNSAKVLCHVRNHVIS